MKQASTIEASVGRDERAGLASILDALIEYRVMIIVTTLVVMMLGASYAFLTPSIYEASVLIKVEDSTGMAPRHDGNELLNNISPGFDEKSSAESEMQVLGSRLIIARAVDALHLYVNAKPHYFPLIGEWLARRADGLSAPGFMGLGGYVWGAESIKVESFEVPQRDQGQGYTLKALQNGLYSLSGPGLPDEGATGTVGRVLRVDSAAGPITLLVKSLVGRSGAEFDLTRESRQLTVDRLQRTLKIKEQGAKSSVLKVSIESPDAARATETINQIGREYEQWNAARKAVIAKNSLDYLQSQLPSMARQVREAEDAYNNYRNGHSLLDMNEEARLLLSRSADATTKLIELQQRRATLLATFSASYPAVAALDKQIGSAQKYIDDLNSQIKGMPTEQQGAMRLMRDVRVNTDLYTTLRNNIEQLRVIQAGKAASAQLIDTADVPEKPVKPIKWLVMLVSTMFGLLSGIGLAIARDYVFRGVTDSREIEIGTGLSVFAAIPQSDKQQLVDRKAKARTGESLLLASLYPRDAAVEALRILRSALQFAQIGARNNVVMIAGPLPGIGKSFLSANLAALLASGGRRVLLIDGDLRKGHLHRLVGLQPGQGLADVLAGTCELDAAIARDVQPRLDVLQTGPYPSHPAELLMLPRYREMIESASARYDIVVIDGPPVLVASDTGIMAPVAGLLFLVARFADTRVRELEESVKRLGQTGARVNGVLLNGINMHTMDYALARRYGSRAYVAYDYHSDSTTR
ncbi:polysaccharide biosynthesis tyrosine autokinase [Paraburkholderia sp. 22099]|uniref:polysaccharide biosynthesis tyrosine autokinase n=1 Tax=Paraburkholderia TaxID=1822464 RepID=UPI002861ADBA|nr:polysaccharide biosynthesis tyrosine autokinase [Paraburkholderia terricola]MDR6492269.1 tyrosine-protein kinase Etk/Wzc [Paraburkholderia terricola]